MVCMRSVSRLATAVSPAGRLHFWHRPRRYRSRSRTETSLLLADNADDHGDEEEAAAAPPPPPPPVLLLHGFGAPAAVVTHGILDLLDKAG